MCAINTSGRRTCTVNGAKSSTKRTINVIYTKIICVRVQLYFFVIFQFFVATVKWLFRGLYLFKLFFFYFLIRVLWGFTNVPVCFFLAVEHVAKNYDCVYNYLYIYIYLNNTRVCRIKKVQISRQQVAVCITNDVGRTSYNFKK